MCSSTQFVVRSLPPSNGEHTPHYRVEVEVAVGGGGGGYSNGAMLTIGRRLGQ